MGVIWSEPRGAQTATPSGYSAFVEVLVGAVCGLAWAAGFRAYMAELVGAESRFDWYGTFIAVLGAGLLTGALLGLAEYFRRTGGRRHWRWLALAPLAFVILPLTIPGALAALFTEGLGGGAIGVGFVAIAGGFAIAGRGARWARIVCGVISVLTIAGVAFSVPAVSAGRLSLDEPRGLWVATLGASYVIVLCLATSIPFREIVVPQHDIGRLSESR